MSNKSYPENSAHELTVEESSGEPKEPIDQEGFSHKTASQTDHKLRIFFEKIYSAVEVDSNFNSNLKENGIHYGDLSKNYNPVICKTTLDTQNSIFQIEDNEDFLSSCELSFLFNNFTSSKLNLKTLNLIQKKSLLELIKRNREENGIVCPFDEIAYLRLVERDKQNISLNIKKLNVYKLDDVPDQLMPVSVSTYLMPFFFDIFQPSLLKMFSETTIGIVLKLKCKYKPQYHLDNNNLLSSYMQEDILWNCFALFKFKFSMEYQLGFLNYFFAVHCVLKYFDSRLDMGNLNGSDLEIQKKILSIKKSLGFYVEALILNGFLNNKSLNNFLKNNLTKNAQEFFYLDDAIQNLKEITNRFNISRLADLCRIRVKFLMKNFNPSTVNELKISDISKEFLLFDKEFNSFYIDVKNF
jgi:hypothetical protein